jgi:transposase
MIGPTGAVLVMMAAKPVDSRKGAEGLAALVREIGTARECAFAKRLEDGKFRWPNVQDGVMRLSAAEFSALLEGLDWRRVHTAQETPAPVQPG